MFQALARMMDVPTALSLLEPRIRGIGRGGALLVFACCLISLFPLGYAYYRFDLASTWHYFDWLADGAPEDVQAGAAALAANPETAPVVPDDEAMRTLLFILPWCFTLLPSAVQLGLARFINVPGLGQLIKASIAFDLVTDWPTMWRLTTSNPWFVETFRWGPLVWLAQAVATAIGTIIVSLVIQTAFVLVFAVMLYMVWILVFDSTSPRRPALGATERLAP